MCRESRFDDIRPYYDEEIHEAMMRLVSSPHFAALASYVYPEQPLEEVRDSFMSFKNVFDFQFNVMQRVCQNVVANTITELTYDGMERLDPDKRYLFIGNHRDIVLDSCLLMYVLYKNGHETGEITFGSNLMQGQEVIDIGKSNKMFRVERNGTPRDLYNNSLHLSEYIKHAITDKRQSVWIAQRNGRTKDGVDRTDQGVIKMLGMHDMQNSIDALDVLNIVPVSVSYEWEPCDILKAQELYATRNGERYVKRPGEDLNSIITGILQPKGRVHFSVCEPIRREELEVAATLPHTKFNRNVAGLIDERICGSYKLFPNSYIAHDILNECQTYSDYYNDAQYSSFLEHLEKMTEGKDDTDHLLRNILLGIYSNPINGSIK